MNIRIATNQDGDGIRRLYWSAFPERENEIVATLAVELLAERGVTDPISDCRNGGCSGGARCFLSARNR